MTGQKVATELVVLHRCKRGDHWACDSYALKGGPLHERATLCHCICHCRHPAYHVTRTRRIPLVEIPLEEVC